MFAIAQASHHVIFCAHFSDHSTRPVGAATVGTESTVPLFSQKKKRQKEKKKRKERKEKREKMRELGQLPQNPRFMGTPIILK